MWRGRVQCTQSRLNRRDEQRDIRSCFFILIVLIVSFGHRRNHRRQNAIIRHTELAER